MITRARGLRPSSLALSARHHEHGGGAVVERAGVAGRDRAALLEGRLERGQLLQRRRGARPVVLGDDGAVRQRHRHDLAVEVAALLRGDRQLLRALRVLVHVRAADLVALGDVLGRVAHRDVGVRVAVLALQTLVLVGGAGRLGALVVARDPLHAGGDVGVALAGDDGVGGLADRLEAGGAVARDRRAAHAQRQLLGAQRDDARDVEGLQALRHAAAAVELLDAGRVDVGVAVEQRVDHERAHLVWAQLGEGALEGASDRGADGIDDHGFRHLRSPESLVLTGEP